MTQAASKPAIGSTWQHKERGYQLEVLAIQASYGYTPKRPKWKVKYGTVGDGVQMRGTIPLAMWHERFTEVG